MWDLALYGWPHWWSRCSNPLAKNSYNSSYARNDL